MHPDSQKAKHAILLIWIILALEIISLASSYLQYNLLESAQAGTAITAEAAAANDARESMIGYVYLGAYVISAIFFIRWFKSAYHTLLQKVETLSLGEGWTIGGWFVPILNLFRPYQMMKEMYVETSALLLANQHETGSILKPKYVGIWWTLWIINNVTAQISLRVTLSAASINELIAATQTSMFNGILGIPLALVTIKMIKDYSSISPSLEQIPGLALQNPPPVPPAATLS